ncbi:MAG TPA: hypothetical protein VM241_04340 [Candidatus Thermoplasmatota archaeon]|nr:hypothetical protein [Candidatus Thermoplasmatota archaeon]
MASVTVTLPHGLRTGGQAQRQAEVRSLDGDDHAFVAEADLPPAALLSALLGRVVRVGPAPDPDPVATARALSVGEREALALQVRRLSYGERMQAVLSCPACRERLDLELAASDLLLPVPAEPAPAREEAVAADGALHKVRLRPPTGADQEDAAQAARADIGAATDLLLRRCADGVAAWTPALRTAVAQRLAELDPQAEMRVAMRCPACAAEFSALLDAGAFLLQEVRERAAQLHREVHLLASRYHWSERDILALPPRRRSTYLALLAEGRERLG